MDLLIGVFTLFLLYALVCFVGHGYANTVDQVAYWLHQHAGKVRAMHKRRELVVRERWVSTLEQPE